MKEEPPVLVKWLGTIGLVTGFIIGWNGTQNFWAAAICALIVASLGAYIGKVLHRILIIAMSILIAVGSSYVRSTVTNVMLAGVRDSQQQSQTLRPKATTSSSDKTQKAVPANARVIAQRANLRPKPSATDEPDNMPIIEMERGERLEIRSTGYVGNGWYSVRHYGTGQVGWVHGNNIEFE
jgi:hypothetical protein